MARPRSDIRARVLRAARAEFLARGVAAASLRGIARRARTTIGMVYYYFPKKDDLFMGVIEEVYAGFLDDLAAVVRAAPDSRGRLRGLFARVGAISDDEREVILLVVREVISSPPRRARIIDRFLHGHIPLILSVIADGQREGVIDPALPLPLALVVTGSVGAFPQLAARFLPPLGLAGDATAADRLVDLLLGGIGPRAARERSGFAAS